MHPSRLMRSPRNPLVRAFSLVELISVVGMISVLLGLTVPAVRGITGASSLTTGVRNTANLLSLARSEAIARHTAVRFMIATDWPGQPDAAFRRTSLWGWDQEIEQFVQLTPWQELPAGLTFEQDVPEYLNTAAYAVADTSAVRGDAVVGSKPSEANEVVVNQGDATITARFIEFLPSGVARLPGKNLRKAMLVTVPGFRPEANELTYTAAADGRPVTWAQVNVDTLTGRVQVLQP